MLSKTLTLGLLLLVCLAAKAQVNPPNSVGLLEDSLNHPTIGISIQVQDSIVRDIILQICKEPAPDVELFLPLQLPSKVACLAFVQRNSSQKSDDSQAIALLDSLEKLFGTPLLNSPWINPIYAVAMIDIIAHELAKHQLLSETKKQAYQVQIVAHYEASYHRLQSIKLKDRGIVGNKSDWQLLAKAYGFVLVSKDSFPNALVLPEGAIRKTDRSYLALLQYNQETLEQALTTQMDKKANLILYLAIGGMTIGILISIAYHELYRKKRKGIDKKNT